jgi:hypothetical protein
MARTKQEVGDAWGALFGLVVDACQAHHKAHCTCDDETTTTTAAKKQAAKPSGGRRHHRRTPPGEIDGITLTVEQRCPDSWTAVKGEVVVNYDAPAVMQLAPPAMKLLPADGPMATASHAAHAPVDVPQGVSDVVVSLAAFLPMTRGLYVGRLRPVTGGNPDNPVLIYIDDVTP